MNAENAAAREHQFRRRIFWEAAGIVLLFHALLLGLFKYSPRVAPPPDQIRQPVALLVVENLSAEAQSQWRNWLVNHDPTLIARPNRQFSYGKMYNTPARRPIGVSYQPAWPQVAVSPVRIQQFEPLQIVAAESVMPSWAIWGSSPATLAAKTSGGNGGTLQVERDGQILVLPEMPETLRNRRPPQRLTELLIEPGAGEMPRYRVVRSCGEPEADRQLAAFLLEQPVVRTTSDRLSLQAWWPSEVSDDPKQAGQNREE